MRKRNVGLLCIVAAFWNVGHAAGPRASGCRTLQVEGELHAGEGYTRAIGGGLKLYFQPIAAGWILRILPESGPALAHDYAELATPPYQSPSPLSLSTDFAFRAQDAVGWNPRRFRYAGTSAAYQRLAEVYSRFEAAGAKPPAPLQVELSTQVSEASEGTLTLIDARLTPGTADQWRAALAVPANFDNTAHTIVDSPDGRNSALGKIYWVRFRVGLDVGAGFISGPGLKLLPRKCGTR